MSKTFKSLILLVIIFVSAIPARATISDPEIFFKGKVDELYAILDNKNIDEKRQYEEISIFVAKSFCIEEMSCCIMGSRWKKLNNEEKENFKEYFVSMTTNYYLNKIRQYYKEWQIEIFPIGEEDRTKDKLTITVKAKKNGFEDVFLIFSLRLIKDEWRFYNVKALGVAFLANFKNQIKADNKANRAKLDKILKGNWKEEKEQ